MYESMKILAFETGNGMRLVCNVWNETRTHLEVVCLVQQPLHLQEELPFSVKQLFTIQLSCCHSVFIRIHYIIQILR